MAIDVLLPFYGDPGMLRDAVASVLAQDDGDWLLHVVDDGYPDPSVARWFEARDDPRVHYHRNPTTLGVSGNFNRALSLVTQPVCVLMGGDDRMLPGYVRTVRAAFDRFPSADVVQPGVRVIDEAGRGYVPAADRVKSWFRPAVRGVRILVGEEMARSLARADWAYFPSLAWSSRTILATGFHAGLDVTLDLALLLDVAMAGGQMVVLSEPQFEYRRHRASYSSRLAVDGGRFTEERALFAATARDLAALGWDRAARAARWHVSSRMHAASRLPRALVSRQWPTARLLTGHVLGCEW